MARSSSISLFVGNVSKYISQKDLEHEFGSFGKCRVNHRGSYAFVEFEDERDAEDAKMVLNNKNLGGLNVNIEWSKRSGNYNPRESIRNR
jgi:arginine/serine-rich splicing factor 7